MYHQICDAPYWNWAKIPYGDVNDIINVLETKLISAGREVSKVQIYL